MPSLSQGFAAKLNWPTAPGREDFKGDLYHSGNWPDGLEAEHLKGKRVAVVGSGASGVQCTQGIGPHVSQVSVAPLLLLTSLDAGKGNVSVHQDAQLVPADGQL